MSLIIVGFPGVGKTTYAHNNPNKAIDLDVSEFRHDEAFPTKYFERIRELFGQHQYLMVSGHPTLIRSFQQENYPLMVVLPEESLLEEYIKRYQNRGSSDRFIERMKSIWSAAIAESETCGARIVRLGTGTYISDIIKKLEEQKQ